MEFKFINQFLDCKHISSQLYQLYSKILKHMNFLFEKN